ncbi:hypothetical protein [Ferviditalea candida]|uniref:Uncharacterized protein n=1 Tax=Ferviditalea candida TaxID=3108399 RepID=A0ABU5ZK55_9BACL|nr:hypothetical protein [Paenibacillaceae bacterium T2]
MTIRRGTESPETVVCGSNTLSGLNEQRIADCVRLMSRKRSKWVCPAGYDDPDVSDKVANMIVGGLHFV